MLALRALALPERHEVVLPSLSYRRMADVARWASLVPRFCDVDPDTLAVDASTVEPCLGPDTAAVLAVHPIVNCCAVDEVEELARSRRLPLLVDGVESCYETFHGRKVGSFGNAEVFSLHASKLINGFEGGYLTTDDEDLATELALERGFGFSGHDNVEHFGINAKLNEVHAAMALANLDELEEQVADHRRRYHAYRRALAGVPGVRLLAFDGSERMSCKNIVVELLDEWPLPRALTLEVLWAEGILACLLRSGAPPEADHLPHRRRSPAEHRAPRRAVRPAPLGLARRRGRHRGHHRAPPLPRHQRGRRDGGPRGRDRSGHLPGDGVPPVSALKRVPTDFAFHGGTPAFDHPLPVGQLHFPSWERYEAAMRDIFERGWFTNHGPLAQELERRFAELTQVCNAVTVTNATLGLVMGAKALGLTGRLVVPSFTFVATVQAMTWAGLEVVFADVDPDTHQLTPATVAPVLDDDVCAVLAVNLWGGTCGPDALEALCTARGLTLFFDSAHDTGVSVGGRPLGGHGALEVFSFHATKALSATEGGYVCTDDDLAARLRNIRSS